ncbi:MAG TPA: DUF1080 domain-containing protein [Gemmatimonadaceae bacterium]|nr:DUF1080 domain-containing protein [Gemmatimonadaceae bacterium]
MWRYSALLLALLLPPQLPARSTRSAAPPTALIGRWDITIRTPDGELPSWLEIRDSGRDALVGRFVGVVGSARPISRVDTTGDSLHFTIPHQWEDGNGDLSVQGRLMGDRLAGSMTFPDGKRYDWTAVRAPSLHRSAAPAWGAPIHLLHANDLGGWHAVGGGSGGNQWQVANGVLRSPHSGANIVTDRTFGDFKLHVEFRYPKESNSGVYLRGRYEVQIQDDFGNSPADDRFSGIYGFISPSEIAARRPGEWQSYDVTLVGRMVTVVANGRRVICDQEIPGITGGAIDSNEGTPGPLLLQGDHGPIEYRNIIITPAR